jgi:hypothetical protein
MKTEYEACLDECNTNVNVMHGQLYYKEVCWFAVLAMQDITSLQEDYIWHINQKKCLFLAYLTLS